MTRKLAILTLTPSEWPTTEATRTSQLTASLPTQGTIMADGKRIDFTKLLGFKTVSEQISEGLDLQDETVAAKLGAKVGGDIRSWR